MTYTLEVGVGAVQTVQVKLKHQFKFGCILSNLITGVNSYVPEMRFGTFGDIRTASFGHSGNCSTHVHEVLNLFWNFNQHMTIFVYVQRLKVYQIIGNASFR